MSASHACASPLSLETLVAYWAGELDATQTDEVDAHVFSCATCTKASERIAAISETLRSVESYMLEPARLAELRAEGRRIDDNLCAPGSRTRVVFGPQEMIIHHLGGLEVDDVDRVSVVVRVEETGDLIAEVPQAPFDAAKGEVLVACQRHFVAFPPNVDFEVTTFSRGEKKKVTRYVVEHEWVGS